MIGEPLLDLGSLISVTIRSYHWILEYKLGDWTKKFFRNLLSILHAWIQILIMLGIMYIILFKFNPIEIKLTYEFWQI